MIGSLSPLSRIQAALAERYAVQRELGAGGMATVYLAEDRRHRRPVAVKVLKPELAQAIGSERFLREIEISARLHHPHILPLYDSGEADGFLYYVMPYAEGESLRDRLDREKQLPLDDALQIAREVADALSYAHSRGVVHRDVKPDNILLESGHAMVADFGIARAISEAGGESLTATGIAIGTPAYMSPEQAAGEGGVDGRSDLYSLGCVLYEMLAGEPPFTGRTVASVVHQHLSVPPPSITSLRPAVPAWVAAALDRALAKTPADRFSPVALFAEALGGRPPSASATAEAPRRRPLPAHLLPATVAAVVVLGAAVLLLRSGGPDPSLGYPRTALAVLPFQNLSVDPADAYFSGGLHDELLTQLSRVEALKVISRTSVLGYEGTRLPMRQIAMELGVGSIVEGSVQVVGGRLRVNVQLIDAATDGHLWAESYDRALDDAFAIQSDIAQRVVTAVGAALPSEEARAIALAPTANPEAYLLYLQGEDYRRRGWRREDFASAEQLYERATALDPTFALAYASLSQVHGELYWFGYDPYPARLELQRAAAETALRLAPDLPQVRWAMGLVHYFGEHDYARARAEFEAALRELPGSAELWTWLGYAHRRLGNWDEALAALERAIELDPRDVSLFADLGARTMRVLHRYAEASDFLDRALALAPDLWGARLRKGWIQLVWRGELDTLRHVLEQGPESYGASGSRDRWRAYLTLLERQPGSLLALLGTTNREIFEGQTLYEPAQLYVGWAYHMQGNRDAAARAFTAALAQLDSASQSLPDHWPLRASRGLALAALGREGEARIEADVIRRHVMYERDVLVRPRLSEARAMIYAQVGLVEEALVELEPLLEGPSWTSVPLVRLDPRWDPIRHDPRFEALLLRYASR